MAKNRNGSFTLQERSWIKYDVGNSAFVMLSAALIPIYFAGLAEPGSSVVVAWGFAETIAALILALAMPVLGSIADIMGNKRKFLVGTAGTGILACAALGIPTNAVLFLVVYIIASVMLNSSMVFYDAFLVDATTPERYDTVSSAGYAWGYIGSCIPFIICLAIVLGGGYVGIGPALGMKIAFLVTAAWWLAFTIPVVRHVKQKHGKPKGDLSPLGLFRGVVGTIKRIARTKGLMLFVLAYFFYIDGVHTIIKMAVTFGDELGLDSSQMVLALLLTQFVAFPSAIVYGKLAGKVGAWKMIVISVVCYFFIVLYAAFFLKTTSQFWILATAVGLFQGGIQALSRSYFASIIPPDHSDELFGIFDIFGKYASAMGTFLVSVMTMATGNPSMGVFSLAAMFAIAFVLLLKMPKLIR